MFFYGGAYLSSQIDQETTAERQDVQLVCFSLSSFLYFFSSLCLTGISNEDVEMADPT